MVSLDAMSLESNQHDKADIPRKINSLTYNAVVALHARIPAQLDRTWAQDPIMLEDALGRPMPFHLECIESWEVGNIKFAVGCISS